MYFALRFHLGMQRGCWADRLAGAMAVGQVPVAKGVSVEECADVLAQLRGVEAGTCAKEHRTG